MRLFDFVSVKLTLCLIAGILVGWYFDSNPYWAGGFLVLSLVGMGIAFGMKKRGNYPLFTWFTGSTTLLLGIFVMGLQLPCSLSHYAQHIDGKPTEIQIKITEVLKPNAYADRYVAAVQSVSKNTRSGQLLLYVGKDSLAKPLLVDDELLTHGSITPLRPPLNPHQFDFKDYLNKKGIHGQLQLSKGQWIKKDTPTPTLSGMAANFRAALIQKLQKQPFGKQELGVIQALLLGQRSEISEATYTDYKNAGAVHILAVSGLHVGILLLILEFLFKPLERLRNGKTLKVLLIIALMWSFAFVAGLSPSIVRAVTMFSFLAYALHLNRPTNTFNVLAWSMFFILLVKPRFLFQVGFQMSYAAVFAIVWIYPKLQAFWHPKNIVVRKVWQLTSVSMAAQLGVLPLSLFYFHQFPALFFVSNLVVVPFLGLVLGMGILVLVLTHFELLPVFIVKIYDVLIGFMNGIIHWVAQQETFLFQDIPFDGFQLMTGYLLIVTLVLALSRRTFPYLALTLSGILLFSGYLIFQEYRLSKVERVLLPHQNRNSMLLYQKADGLTVFSRHQPKNNTTIMNFAIGERIKSIAHDTLLNSYNYGNQRILVVDGTGTYPPDPSTNIVLLTGSPKVHLERLIDTLRPKILLADGSNYKSYVNRWKETCNKRKLPFHYTGEKGAYEFFIDD